MRKFYHLFLLLITFSSVINAQSFQTFKSENEALTLSKSIIVTGMSSDGKYVVGEVSYTVPQKGVQAVDVAGRKVSYLFTYSKEDGINERDYALLDKAMRGSAAKGISNTGRIAGYAMSPDWQWDVEFLDYDNVYLYDEDGNYIIGDDGERVYNGDNEPFFEPMNSPTGAFREYNGSTWTYLPVLDRVTQISYYIGGNYANAITDDGNIIVGGFAIPGGPEAYRRIAGYWKINGENVERVQLLPDITFSGSTVNAVSGDGKVMGGHTCAGNESMVRVPAIWKADDEGKMQMSLLPGAFDGEVVAISNNGKYAVVNYGFHENNNSYEYAALFNLESNTYRVLSSNKQSYVAFAVSDNGTVVGHWGKSDEGQITYSKTGFIYTPTRGMLDVTTLLADLDVTGADNFNFTVVSGISADASVITGYGKEGSNQVGFYAEIPAIPEGVYGVEEIQVVNKEFGAINISWKEPADNIWDAPLSGYELYCNDKVLVKLGANVNSYEHKTTENGTYTYYVQALYDTYKDSKALESPVKSVTMGKLQLPYFDTFDGYTTGVSSSLSTVSYWDISYNNPSLGNWQPQLSGYPPYCLEFKVPGNGTYEETFTSAFIDATELESLHFNFVMLVTTSAAGHNMAVDVYDGTKWYEVADMAIMKMPNTTWEAKRYDLTEITVGSEKVRIVGKNNVRVRLRAYGEGNGYQDQWDFDNLEITDGKNALTHPKPLDIQVTQDEKNNVVIVSWISPEETAKLKYVDTELWTANMVSNEGVPFIAANKYPKEELGIYKDYYITHLSFMPSHFPYDKAGNEIPTNPAKYRWYIMQRDKRLCEEDVTGVDYSGQDLEKPESLEWFTAKLETPIKIDTSYDLYFGVEVVEHDAHDCPIATSDVFHSESYMNGDVEVPLRVSHNVADGRGNIYSEDDGKTWETVPYYYDDEFKADIVYPLFNISATLAKNPESESDLPHFTSYKVLRNGENIITERFGNGNYHTRNTVIIDDNFPNKGEEACYEVKAHYITLVDSESESECITMILTPTAIDSFEKDDNGVSVYPSPVIKGQSINVDLGEAAEYTGNIKVYNTTGGLFRNIPINDRITNVNIDFPAGIYFVQVNDKVVKIVVE